METRRLITALIAGFVIFFAYRAAYEHFFPAPQTPPPTSQPQELAPGPSGTSQPVGQAPATGAPAGQTQPTTLASAPARPGEGLAFVGGQRSEPLTIGTAQDDLKLQLTPHGAAVTNIWLTERKNGEYRYRVGPRTDEPYELLTPVEEDGRRYHSYLTHKLRIEEFDNRDWPLDDLIWEVAGADERKATFTATLRWADRDGALLRVTKTYELQSAPKLLHLTLAIENLSDQSLNVQIDQDGPVGIHKEQIQYDMRRLTYALRDGETISVKGLSRRDLAKLPPDKPRDLGVPGPDKKFLWVVLGNKFFGVFTRPLQISGDVADYLERAVGLVAVRDATTNPGDMLVRFQTKHLPIGAGGRQAFTFEIYAGPKDSEVLEKTNPAFADRAQLGYSAAQDADRRCCCAFHPLPAIMKWLLHTIVFVVRNYGVAIIIMVLIIRTLLHPLAVYQQKSMFRMQEAQARIQPKMQALRERHANDKARLNQEMMKLWKEENVNPMGMMVGMLPLLIQMPILVALWTSLNTDIQLRHAPFDGWWIYDLSAPDALVKFGGAGLTIPVLGWLPMIGRMFQNIPSLNLLPILMGISMWLQQKYMPKPAQQARLEAARKQQQQAPKKGGGGMSPQDQLRQQQMIAYMMAVMFPLMFYYMPSGLNLYWMSTNVFGIFESLVIRKQLKAEKERGGPPGPEKKQPGLAARLFARLAERAEEIQRKADELSDQKKKRR
jgi:YidC/Oxa1 family membrane protein insertase